MSFGERRRLLWILFIVGLCLIALVARATTLERLRFEELVRQAGAIARLRCLATEGRWEKREIWTETQFEVVQTEKGLLPGLIAVRMLGGRAGHLESHVDGVPRFQPGEEVYLFLWGESEKPYRVLGWAQGTFRIERNPRTGQERVTQDSATAPIFDPETRSFRPDGISRMPVAVFRERLRRAVNQAQSR